MSIKLYEFHRKLNILSRLLPRLHAPAVLRLRFSSGSLVSSLRAHFWQMSTRMLINYFQACNKQRMVSAQILGGHHSSSLLFNGIQECSIKAK